MSEKNKMIHEALYKERVYAYEAAGLLGISVSTYNRMIRSELPQDQQIRIVKLIEEYAAKRSVNNG